MTNQDSRKGRCQDALPGYVLIPVDNTLQEESEEDLNFPNEDLTVGVEEPWFVEGSHLEFKRLSPIVLSFDH